MRRLGYADQLPWYGSNHTWPTEVSESPPTNPSQGALVWTVVFPKDHVRDPFDSSSMHASQLFKVVEEQLLHKHCYSDDTQIYLSFLKA